MKQSENKIILRWDKFEHDWKCWYPDNNGKSFMNVLFTMINTKTGHSIDWNKDLKEMLEERGYDYKTFRIEVSKKK